MVDLSEYFTGASRLKRRNAAISLVVMYALFGFYSSSQMRNGAHHRMPVPKSGSRELLMKSREDMLSLEVPIGKSQRTTVLLGIFTNDSKEEEAKRVIIRRTYLKADNRICTLEEYKNQVATNSVRCQVPYVFVIGGGTEDRPYEHHDNKPLLVEPANAESDAIYLNIKENVDRGKAVSYFRYASSIADRFQIDYMAKTDTDTIISARLFLNFIELELAPKPFNRRIYGGRSMYNFDRNSIYASGDFYFMSSDLSSYISNVMTTQERQRFTAGGKVTTFEPIEDVDVGTFIFTHPRPIKFINLASDQFWKTGLRKSAKYLQFWRNQMHSLPGADLELPFSFHCPNWGFK